MKLNELIDKHNKEFSTYYKGELYSHTPMALFALKDLGASDERLEEFYEFDVKKLEPIVNPTFLIDNSNWEKHLGNYKYEASYVDFFRSRVQEDGIEFTVQKYFDVLMKGVGAAAFHPIIRLSYAIRENNENEIIISLATWAASYLDLGVSPSLDGDKTFLDVIGSLKQINFNQGLQVEGKNIVERMSTVSKTREYKECVQKISLTSSHRDELEKILLWLFSQSNNFTLLHGVTSHHAFESLVKFSKQEELSRGYLVKAILAAYLSTTGVFAPDLDWRYPSFENLPSWDVIKQKAISSNDDHVIKLVHVLGLKDNYRNDGELRYACLVKLGLISNEVS